MGEHSNRLRGWHFVAGALCPACHAQDSLKFHFSEMRLHCVDCGLHATSDDIEKLAQRKDRAEAIPARRLDPLQ